MGTICQPPKKRNAVVRPQNALQRLFCFEWVWVWQDPKRRQARPHRAWMMCHKEKIKISIYQPDEVGLFYSFYYYFIFIFSFILCRGLTCDRLTPNLRQIDTQPTTDWHPLYDRLTPNKMLWWMPTQNTRDTTEASSTEKAFTTDWHRIKTAVLTFVLKCL